MSVSVCADLSLPTADLWDTLKVVLAIAAPLAGIGATAWKLGKRFRPSFHAEIDPKRQGIRLCIRNRGRRKGQVRTVAAVDNHDAELPTQFAGLPDGDFHSAWLGGKERRHLIINAIEESGSFPDEAWILVEWGRDDRMRLSPTRGSHAIYGLMSDWPGPESGGDAE